MVMVLCGQFCLPLPSTSPWSGKSRTLEHARVLPSCSWPFVPRFLFRNRRVSVAAAATSEEAVVPLEECIAQMKAATSENEAPNACITLSGKQWFLEMEGEYTFSCCMDGRFHERFKGENITVEWAHDGSHTWYADFAGRVTGLQLDGLESCLLTTWIRTGFWLTDRAQSKVSIDLGTELLDPPVFKQPRTQILNVQLKDYKKVTAYVVVDLRTFLPIKVVTKICGSVDTWEFSEWQILQPESKWKVPFSVSHLTNTGSLDSIFITSGRVSPHATLDDDATFAMPSSPLKPRDNVYPRAVFDPTVSPHVDMIVSESGHCLIQPKLDGHELGYFIVDTGASSLSLATEYAKTLFMENFGEIFLLGIESRVQSRFVRGKELQIGCLKILDPIFMECSIGSDVVKGPSPIVGICGFDIFFHCIAEISMSKGLLSLFDPSTYTSSYILQWQTMYLLNNVPHVPVKINGQETVLLLDTGAGGIDVILHARAGRELGITGGDGKASTDDSDGKASTKDGEDKGLQADCEVLKLLEVGDLEFHRPRCYVLTTGNLDISAYSSGLLCGDLLKTSVVVFDYQNCRFAIAQSSG